MDCIVRTITYGSAGQGPHVAIVMSRPLIKLFEHFVMTHLRSVLRTRAAQGKSDGACFLRAHPTVLVLPVLTVNAVSKMALQQIAHGCIVLHVDSG